MPKRLTDIQKTPRNSQPIAPAPPATQESPSQPAIEKVVAQPVNSTRRKFRPWRWVVAVVIAVGLGLLVTSLGGGVIGGILQYKELSDLNKVEYTADELAQQGENARSIGDLAAAERAYELAVAKEAKVDHQIQLGLVKYRLKKYDQSIESFRALLASSNEPAFLWNGIGNMYRDWAYSEDARRAERLLEAENAYQSALAADAKYVAAYSNLALMLEEKGQISAAVQTVQSGVLATQNKDLQILLDRLSTKSPSSENGL